MSSDSLQQSGARSPGNEGTVDDPWAFLGTHSNYSKCDGMKEVLKELSSEVTPYAWLKIHANDVPKMYKHMTGYIGGLTPNTNPFIRSSESVPVEDFITTQQKLKDGAVNRLEIERLLREVLIAQYDAVRSTVALLSLLNTELLTRVKRTVVISLEDEADCKSWNAWKEYAGTRPEGYSEVKKRRAKEDFERFWRVCDKLLNQIVTSLKETIMEDEPLEDVERMLKKWRDIGEYFKDAHNWNEVLDRERIIFDMLCQKVEITWETRRILLMKVLSREEMGLTQNIIDSRLIEMEEAETYSEWLKNVQQILKIALVKNLTFKGSVDKKKIDFPVRKFHEGQALLPRDRAPYIKNEPPRLNNLWCNYCKRHGHTINECRSRSMPPRGPNICFNCGESGHWAQNCPKKPTQAGGERGVMNPPPGQTQVAKSTQIVPPAPIMPGTSRYGRPYRPTQPTSLHTIDAMMDHVNMEDERQDIEESSESEEVDQESPLPLIPISHHVISEHDVPKDMKMIKHDVPMPTVKIIIDCIDGDVPKTLTGLIDTGSNICYVTRQVVEKLQEFPGVNMKHRHMMDLFAVETMNGINHQRVERVTMIIAIEDTSGVQSAFRETSFIIFEGNKIPGGYDFLLDADWVIDQRLNIRGIGSGYEILLPRASFINAGVMTCGEGVTLHSIELDPPEIEDVDDHFSETIDELAKIMMDLPNAAIRIGPLSVDELRLIKDKVYDPMVQLTIKEGKLDPPCVELGYPAPRQRQEKLMELLRCLERQGVIIQVPKGTGSINARLEPPPTGVRYHDTSTWISGLPSWATYYSTLDVKDAYFRIAISPESRMYLHMSIWSPDGTLEYRWQRMPQGLSVSPSYWCALIESIIQSLILFLESSNNNHYRELLKMTRIQIYFDDILICAIDKASCDEMTALVYQVLTYNGMYLPESKIQRSSTKVSLMGFSLSGGQLHFNDETLSKISNLRRPSTKQELRSALGLLNYVRRSLGTNSDKLNCLYSLVQDKTRFHWGREQEEAWKILVDDFKGGLPIESFSLCPGVEDVSKWNIVIQTDASDTSVGYCTYLVPINHHQPDSQTVNLQSVCDKKLINVGIRQLKGPERLYFAHDREALGIFWALSKNRTLIYLIGKCVLQTDNKTSLSRFARMTPEETSTARGRRWVRWISDLSDLLFSRSKNGGRDCLVEFTHIQGSENSFADYLSRFIMDDLNIVETGSQTDDYAISDGLVLTTAALSPSAPIDQSPDPVNIDTELKETISSYLSKWDADDQSEYIKKIKLRHIYQFLSGIPIDATESTRRIIKEVCERRFSLQGQFLIFHNNSTPVIVVPNVKMDDIPLRTYLVQYIHEKSPLSAHRAELGTRSLLRRTFWWPHLDEDVKRWILSCMACAVRKLSSSNGSYNPRKLQAPNQILYVDWAGPFQPSVAGYKYVLLLVDGFSGYSIALPFRSKSAENSVDGLFTWMSLFGTIDSWTSDNDSTFIADMCRTVRSLIGIKDLIVPTYSPSTQGTVERAVRTLKESIETIILGQVDDDVPIDWVTLIKACTFSSNSLVRFGGLSPFEVMLGRSPVDPLIANFGIVETRTDVVDHDDYVTKLKSRLNEIHSYWSSKVMEVRNRTADRECNGLSETLNENDICVRVSYINGRRHCLGKFIILRKQSNNIYQIKNIDSGSVELSHGYQLHKILPHPDRPPIRVYDHDDDEYYLIERVLSYDPTLGYLVKWVGFVEPTYQRASDMPPSFRKQMAIARNKFNNRMNTLGGSVALR